MMDVLEQVHAARAERGWEIKDCFLLFHSFTFWTKFSGMLDKTRDGRKPDGDASAGLRAWIDGMPAYVRTYVQQDKVVLIHEPSRQHVSVKVPDHSPG